MLKPHPDKVDTSVTGSSSKKKTFLKKFALRLSFAITLVVLSIRDYLFGTGLFIYRDWSWPLSTKLTPVSILSLDVVKNSEPDPFGFTRLFLTWPIAVINSVTGDAVTSEKVFVVYLYSVMILLSFVLAELLLRLLNKHSRSPMSPWKGELFSLLVVLISFANFWSLQQLSDFYFTSFVEFVLISISVTLVVLWNGSYRAALMCGGLISLATFLDPDLSGFGVIAVGITLLGTLLTRSLSLRSIWTASKRIIVMIAATLPSLLSVLYILSQTTGTNLRPAGTYQSAVVNLSLPNALRLMGYWWSLIAYSPPSILGLQDQVQQLPAVGSPPYLILPSGALTIFWIATTWSLPVVAFFSLLIRTFRKITIPVSLVALAGLLMTQPSIFPFPYWLATSLKDYPIIGGALITIFAIPDHILVMVASAYIVLAAVAIYGLLSSDILATLGAFHINVRVCNPAPQIKSPSRRSTMTALTVALILFVLLFPAWQLFSGSFYPSGYTDGGKGNGLSTVGAFSPSQPPTDMTDVYNWLLSQPNDFSVYWPGPDGREYTWSEKTTPGITNIDSPLPTFHLGVNPTWFPAGLQYLISSNLTSDVGTYLRALNMKYVVVQPLSEASALSAWGIHDTRVLSAILSRTDGIRLAHTKGDILVYVVNDTWGSVYAADRVAGYLGGDQRYSIAYDVLSSLGIHLALVRANLTADQLCFDNPTCSISIFSPSYLYRNNSQFEFDALNQTNVESGILALAHGQSKWLPMPWNSWTSSNWGPSDATVQFQHGAMNWTLTGGTTLLSLSYNGTVTDNNVGGVKVPRGKLSEVAVSFWYRTSSNFDTSLQIALPVLNSSLVTVGVPASEPYSPSAVWKKASFNVTLPIDASYFTPRIQTKAGSGWVQIRDVRLGVNFLKMDYSTPFGRSATFATSAPQYIGGFPGWVHVKYLGTGTLYADNQLYALSSPNSLSWLDLPPSSSLRISGNATIGVIVATRSPLPLTSTVRTGSVTSNGASITVASIKNVVYTRMYAPGYSMKNLDRSYSPHATLDGTVVFLDVKPGVYNLAFSSLGPIRVTYFASLILVLVIVTTCIDPRRVSRFAQRVLGFRKRTSPYVASLAQ
jgi:hypothetical protein